MPFLPWVATVGNSPTPLPVAQGGTGATTAAGGAAALGTLNDVATTGAAGFALQNATPNILTWSVPNDGAQHRFLVVATQRVTTAETGGAVQMACNIPDGTAVTFNVFAGGGSTGTTRTLVGSPVQAGSTVSLQQSSALTAGAATVWADLLVL